MKDNFCLLELSQLYKRVSSVSKAIRRKHFLFRTIPIVYTVRSISKEIEREDIFFVFERGIPTAYISRLY